MNDASDREVAIFGAAVELPASQRASYLDEACSGDDILRQRVESFLADHEKAGAFLGNSSPWAQHKREATLPGSPPGTLSEAERSEKPGDRIGRYKLLQQIGEGGCGLVYLAEQEEPIRRKVAIKVIKLGMDTGSVIARFEAERQALALMDHPNIAKVLDAGATEAGRPYFVMELVRGVRITDFCDQNRFDTRQRLELFVQVCQAIQHAHQKGVIHRDIKPSNILVAMNDGVPVPKVIDFGIAKATQGRLTDRTLLTAFERFIGTPAYMSPEQAVMTSLDIDTRSDIYSLGVLLYELLTGNTPFDTREMLKEGLDEMRRTIMEKQPVRPSARLSGMPEAELTTLASRRRTEPPKLMHSLRGDLDWIVMKALEKDRSRRYETSNGLGRDVERYLVDEPVVARPPSKIYRFRKLVQRHKLVFGSGLVVAVSLVLALAFVTLATFRIKLARDNATEKLRISYLAEARALRTGGQASHRFASLETVRKAAAIRPDLAVRNEAIASLATSDMREEKQTILTGYARNELAHFDFNVERYAIGDAKGDIRILAVSNGLPVGTLSAPGYILESINSFSPDSRYLHARYWHGPAGKSAAVQSECIWDTRKQSIATRINQEEAGLNEATFDLAGEFSSDSRVFACSRPDGSISVYDLASATELQRLSAGRRFNHLRLDLENSRVACSADADSKVEIYEVKPGRNQLSWPCAAPAHALAWSPDGKLLATGCADYNIYVWEAQTGRQWARLEGATARITSLEFNHAGNLLASAGFDGAIRLWNPRNGRMVASHAGGSWHLQFSADDGHLMGWNQFARYGWLEVAYSQECRLLYVPRDGADFSGPEFSADGRMLSAGTYNHLRFWDAASGKELGSFPLDPCDTHIFHPDGRRLITIDRLGGVSARPLERTLDPAALAYRIGKPRRLFEVSQLRDGALSRDGRHLAVTHELAGESLVFDLEDASAKPVVLQPHPRVNRIDISPDGRWVASASLHNSIVKVWDARTGDLVRTLPAPGRTRVAFSPDGRWLATSSSEYQLWAVGSWQAKGAAQRGHELPEWNFTAFSQDGAVMARVLDGLSIQLLETSTERPLATLEAPVSTGVAKIQFSPDGSQIAAIQQDQQVQLWDLRLLRQKLEQMQLDWGMPPYPPVDKLAARNPVVLEIDPAR